MDSVWPPIAEELDQHYLKESREHPEYFYSQSFGDDDFMKCLMPSPTWTHPTQGTIDCRDKFFGTKVLTIFIAQKPYGWVNGHFDWGDPGSEYSIKVSDAVLALQSMNKRFPYYKTIIYVDMYTAMAVRSKCPSSDMPQKMCRTATKMQELATTTIGFEWGGLIRDQVPADYFKPKIDEFYGTPKYKIDNTFV